MLARTSWLAVVLVLVLGCRTKPAAPPPQVLEGTYIVGARLPIRERAGGPVVATTTCSGPTAILAREANGMRVRAFDMGDDFVGEGFVDDRDVARVLGDPNERGACDGGMVVVRSASLPDRASLPLVPPGLTRVDRGATWDGDGEIFHDADCARSLADGATMKEHDERADGTKIDRTWGLSLEDEQHHVRLTGPTEVTTKKDGTTSKDSYLCLRDFVVVGRRGPTLVVLRAGARLASVVPVAYDASDAVSWYRTSDACLRENPKPGPALAAELVLRHGCS